MSKKVRAVQGGTSASKTISILLYLIARAQSDKTPTLTSVISESTPHLKRGAIRDFKNIMQTHKYWKDALWNATDNIYTFETGSKIEFFSADQSDKLRGARRDRCFINEANNVSLDAFDQVEVRTKEFIFLDWNPTNEFWLYTDVKYKRDDVEHITLTYKDNEALSPEIINSIEQRKGRKGWWKVYGLGELGEVEGKIYKDWQIIDEIPFEARLERYGLDFGYSNDPSAIIAIYRYDGGYILDEIAFMKQLSNKQLADMLLNEDQALVIADSAEPKSIDEIKAHGVNIRPANKGRDSVSHGIQLIQDQRISVTKRSYNIIKEYRNYLWDTDREGRILNVPEHEFSHCFAPETTVHTTQGDYRIDELVGQSGFLFSGSEIKRFYDVRPTRMNAEVVTLHTDNGVLTVTPDHLIMLPNGEWIEAGLLSSGDLIQYDTYGEARIWWGNFYSLCKRKILKRLCEWKELVDAQICMDRRERRDTCKASYPPCGQKPVQQSNRELGVSTDEGAFVKVLRDYSRKERKDAKESARKGRTKSASLAWVRRGDKVACTTWEEDVSTKETLAKRMRSLSQRFYYKGLFKIYSLLSSELQDESKTTKIERITRGRRSITYNLEVEDNHYLSVGGAIAHNSMDAIRYGLVSLLEKPTINKYKRHVAKNL